jgi:hypothetical protein
MDFKKATPAACVIQENPIFTGTPSMHPNVQRLGNVDPAQVISQSPTDCENKTGHLCWHCGQQAMALRSSTSYCLQLEILTTPTWTCSPLPVAFSSTATAPATLPNATTYEKKSQHRARICTWYGNGIKTHNNTHSASE